MEQYQEQSLIEQATKSSTLQFTQYACIRLQYRLLFVAFYRTAFVFVSVELFLSLSLFTSWKRNPTQIPSNTPLRFSVHFALHVHPLPRASYSCPSSIDHRSSFRSTFVTHKFSRRFFIHHRKILFVTTCFRILCKCNLVGFTFNLTLTSSNSHGSKSIGRKNQTLSLPIHLNPNATIYSPLSPSGK